MRRGFTVDPRGEADQLWVKARRLPVRSDAELEGVGVLVLDLVEVEAGVVGVGGRLGRHLAAQSITFELARLFLVKSRNRMVVCPHMVTIKFSSE